MWRTFVPLLIVAFLAVCYAAPEPESPMSHLQDDILDNAGADADADVDDLDDAIADADADVLDDADAVVDADDGGKNTHLAYVKR